MVTTGPIIKINNPNPLIVAQFRKDALRMQKGDFDGAKRLNKLIWQWQECVFREEVYQAKKKLGIA